VREPAQISRSKLGTLWSLPKRAVGSERLCPTDRARAEALFKKEKQMRKGAKAMAEYEVAQQVTREKTARLRALRLARDAAKQSRI
jgi:multidrug efflux pump subunit AcrA (membrane-fusion protein)